MTTISTINTGHFDGGKNLTPGQRYRTDATLEELLAAAKVDIIALEAYVAGLQDPKDSVRLATAGALGACTAAGTGVGKTLTQNVAAVENIDGTALVVGNRVLVKNQVASEDNGIYVVTVVGTGAVQQVLTRATDFDADAEVTAGAWCHVAEGTANADTKWILTTNDPIVLDTTGLTFAELIPVEHAAAHLRGGADEIDGDQIDIDITLTSITPDTSPAEVTNAAHLGAIIKGIDNVIGGGMTMKRTVRLATAGALGAYTQAGAGVGATLTQNVAAIENIDGVALVVGDRVLVNDDGTATAADRGIYTVTVVGTGVVQQVLTRATDADQDAEVFGGLEVNVSEGTVNADSKWILTTNDPIVVDTTGISFSLLNTATHALDHERAGLLEIDGDHLDVDFTPAQYVPSIAPAEAANVDDLAAHLAGIDDAFANRTHKQTVRLATAAALNAYTQAGAGVGATLTQNAPAVENIDGVAVVLGDRILVNDDGAAAAADEGIYTVTTVGTGAVNQVLTRAIDADAADELVCGLEVSVEEGTANAGKRFKQTVANPIVVDTTALAFQIHDPTPGLVGGITDITGAAAAGVAETYARGDHAHKLEHLVSFLAHEGIATGAGNAAAAGAINAHRTFDFDDGGAVVDEQIAFEGRIPEHYTGGDITVTLYWAGAANAGDVKWDVSFERIQLNTLDIDAGDSYAAAQTATDTAPGTVGFVTDQAIVFTQAQADGVIAGDLFRLLVMRDSNDAADTMVGDASLLAVGLTQ